MKIRILISLLLFVSILTLAYVSHDAEARPFSSFKWDIDETYHRDGHVQFVVQQGSENLLPVGIKGLNDVTVTLHPTINHDQTGKAKLPRGVDIYFEPDVIDLIDGEVKPVKLIVNVDENAPSNLYDVQIVGTWKENDGDIPGFMGSSIRLHVGHDFGDGKIPVNMLHPPLKFWKFIQSDGGTVNDVPCRNDYVLVVKYDGSPACVTESTKQKLIERGWAEPLGDIIKQRSVNPEQKPTDFETQYQIARQIYLSIPKTVDSPHLGMTFGNDKKSIIFGVDITKLTQEKNQEYYEKFFEEMFSEIVVPFEVVFQENQGGDESKPPDKTNLDISRIEDGRILLHPENTCASIDLELLTEQDIQRYKNDKNGLGPENILQITSEDLKEIPIIQELIYAAHSIEFPYNKYSSVYLEGLTFVEYEFFLMEKAIKKYGDSQGNYFLKLDKDYEQRFANPAKQGFTNHFDSPVIVYNDAAYSVSGTNFWTSDEHEPKRMSIFPIDGIEDDEKFITLTDEDMKSVPKIKEAIESIGTIQESISAHKGLPEDQWNEYRGWFEQKSQERLNADGFRLIQYDKHLYSIGFGIC